LNQFISYFKNNCENESIYVEGLDFNVFSGTLNAEPVDLDFSSSLLEEYILNLKTGKFESKSIDLKEFCNSKPKNNFNFIPRIHSNHTFHSMNKSLDNGNPILKNISARNLDFDSLNITNKTSNTTLLSSRTLNPEKLRNNQSMIKPIGLNSLTNNKVISNSSGLLINYNKSFFFKQENLLKNNKYNKAKNSEKKKKSIRSNKIMFIEDKSEKSNSVKKKFQRQFLDHLSGIHLFHIN